MQKPSGGAFTLIELLIVVAIIAVLAAIAVPNFLEAQTRAKVSRVNGDHRTLHMACECYYMDTNSYPRRTSKMSPGGFWQTQLTTPLAYLNGFCIDPFYRPGMACTSHYDYAYCLSMKSFITVSPGPDGVDEFNEVMWMCPMRSFYPAQYDPSNGTASQGDIWRVSKQGGPIQENMGGMMGGM